MDVVSDLYCYAVSGSGDAVVCTSDVSTESQPISDDLMCYQVASKNWEAPHDVYACGKTTVDVSFAVSRAVVDQALHHHVDFAHETMDDIHDHVGTFVDRVEDRLPF